MDGFGLNVVCELVLGDARVRVLGWWIPWVVERDVDLLWVLEREERRRLVVVLWGVEVEICVGCWVCGGGGGGVSKLVC